MGNISKKDKRKNKKQIFVKIMATFIVLGLLLPTITTLIQLISMI